MKKQKLAKGLMESVGTLIVVAGERTPGLALGAAAVVVVIAGYLRSD
jgi:hypothetical protein